MLGQNKEIPRDTVYLYDKSQRENYLKELSQKFCPHEKQVYSYLDLNESIASTRRQFWEKHLRVCGVCQSRVKKIEASFREVELFIERPTLSDNELEFIVKNLKKQLRGGDLDLSLRKEILDFWAFNLRPNLFDFLSCFKRPHIQILIVVTVFWLILS